ncbi:MAG: ATP-binding protein [Myxococcota bacterium]|nr:ATP-binding protein [Myxococcota bacterium]
MDVSALSGSVFIGKHLELLPDVSAVYTIADVTRSPLSMRFVRSEKEKPNFGITQSAYWARFALVNRGAALQRYLLELDYSNLDSITLFTPNDAGGFDAIELGDQVSFSRRAIKNRNPVFELEVPANSSQTYFARLATSGSMQIALLLHSPNAFFGADHEQQMALGLYCGVILVMALYNLFLFFSIRDKTYIAYVGYVICIAATNLSLHGVTYEYLFHDWPALANTLVPLSIALTGLWGTVFTSMFLKTRHHSPRLHRFFVGFTVYLVALAGVALAAPYSISLKLCGVTAGLWAIALFVSGVYVWKVRAYEPARFYLLAWAAFLLGVLLLSGRVLGFLPNIFLTEYGVELGSAMEVVLLSFALADRIKQLEKDKNAALAAKLREQEHAESAQRAAAKAWQTTFDAIGSGVCLLDGQGRVLRSNRALSEILQAPPDIIVGTALRDLLKEASGRYSSGAPPGFETPAEREEFFIEFRSRWYSVMHDPIAALCGPASRSVHVMTDVTQQRELEQQLYHAQKMDAIGRLAGGVAHDFNNLLSVIISYGEFLVDSAADDAARQDALEIVKAGQRAAGLTRQLLTFSRKQVLQPAVISTGDIINDLSHMLCRLIGEHLKLQLRLEPGPALVFFDKAQLEQVLVNLVVNARDAMDKTGEITVETSCVELPLPKTLNTGELPAGRYVTISVVDTGAGMDKATQSRVFEPFFTTKGVGKGTGLGLAMVYGAVHQAGGVIGIDSAPGRGTRITLYLARVEGDSKRSSVAATWASVAGQGQTVLVVEDEAPVRAAVQKILSASGYLVLEATSGRDALEILKNPEQSVDILLTDIVMPEMSGVELCAVALELYPDLKTLYMSGYGFEILTEHGVDPSSVRVIGKPFTRSELLAALTG